MYGMTCLQHRYTDRRFTSCTRCHISVDVVRIESSSGGEMPALWNDTSIAPYAIEHGGERGLHVGFRSDVGADEQTVDRGRGGLSGRFVDVDGDHVRALGGQTVGGRQPDPAPGTGDHRDPVTQPVARQVDLFPLFAAPLPGRSGHASLRRRVPATRPLGSGLRTARSSGAAPSR